MQVIKPLPKNKRICIECGATYVTNGDPSGFWLDTHYKPGEIHPFPREGKCEFCRPSSRFSLKK